MEKNIQLSPYFLTRNIPVITHKRNYIIHGLYGNTIAYGNTEKEAIEKYNIINKLQLLIYYDDITENKISLYKDGRKITYNCVITFNIYTKKIYIWILPLSRIEESIFCNDTFCYDIFDMNQFYYKKQTDVIDINGIIPLLHDGEWSIIIRYSARKYFLKYNNHNFTLYIDEN